MNGIAPVPLFYAVTVIDIAVGIGSWCFHMTLQYEMQVRQPSLHFCIYTKHQNAPSLCPGIGHAKYALFQHIKSCICVSFPVCLPVIYAKSFNNNWLHHLLDLFKLLLFPVSLQLLDELPMIYSCCIFVYCL